MVLAGVSHSVRELTNPHISLTHLSLCRSMRFCRHGFLCVLCVCDILGWLSDSRGQGLCEERGFIKAEKQPALHHRLRTTIVTPPPPRFLCSSPSSLLPCLLFVLFLLLPAFLLLQSLPALLSLPPPFILVPEDEARSVSRG